MVHSFNKSLLSPYYYVPDTDLINWDLPVNNADEKNDCRVGIDYYNLNIYTTKLLNSFKTFVAKPHCIGLNMES